MASLTDIPLENLSDRELLLMTARGVNALNREVGSIRATITAHEKTIAEISTTCQNRREQGDKWIDMVSARLKEHDDLAKYAPRVPLLNNLFAGTGALSTLGLILIIIGQSKGWW